MIAGAMALEALSQRERQPHQASTRRRLRGIDGQTSLTGTRGHASMLRNSLIRNCVCGIRCASARATEVDLQACSFIRLRSRRSSARATAGCPAVAASPRRRTTTRTVELPICRVCRCGRNSLGESAGTQAVVGHASLQAAAPGGAGPGRPAISLRSQHLQDGFADAGGLVVDDLLPHVRRSLVEGEAAATARIFGSVAGG